MAYCEINYYECNKDSIWIASIVIFIMIIFIIILKLFVYNDLHKALKLCSPFSYYTGDKSQCVKNAQDIFISQYTQKETFETTTYIEITDVLKNIIDSAFNKIKSILNIYLAITKYIENILNNINNQIQLKYNNFSESNNNIQLKVIDDFIDPFLYKLLSPFIKLYKTINK